VFCIYLRINSDLCHLQHKLIGFYSRDEKCLQRGTAWVFKYSSLRFVCKGLTSRFYYFLVFVESFHFYLLNMQNYHSVDTQLFIRQQAASAAMDLCILRHRTQFELRTERCSSHKVDTTTQADPQCLRMSFTNSQELEFMDILNQKVEEKNVREKSYCSRGDQNNVIDTI
jgi:hypothetical protein